MSTTNALVYTQSITKLPEQGFTDASEYWILPCSNMYSVLQVFNDFFIIIDILYNRLQIKNEMLEHIRTHFNYYQQITYAILKRKKLDLSEWLACMANKPLPADEICLTACEKLLKIHVSVDYRTGTWTSFELSSPNHDYIIENSDVHLIYRGACTYNLLCKQQELKTKGRKLLDYKLYRMDLIKPMRIELKRIEDSSSNSNKSIHTQQDNVESDATETYYQVDEAALNAQPPDNQITQQNDSDSDDTEIYYHENTTDSVTQQANDSDTTETYEMTNVNSEKIRQPQSTKQGSFIPIKTKKGSTKKRLINSKSEYKKQSFKCQAKNCTVKSETRKELYQHYKARHKRVHKCKKCEKRYKTPYSLDQHNYIHRQSHQMQSCKKCNKTFAFRSQMIIHRNKHSINGKYECTECYAQFKYLHDMYRHRREHTAKMLQCSKCEYIGTALNLKEHAKQHSRKSNKICVLCNKSFKFRMELWWHRRHCYRSDSPEF